MVKRWLSGLTTWRRENPSSKSGHGIGLANTCPLTGLSENRLSEGAEPEPAKVRLISEEVVRFKPVQLNLFHSVGEIKKWGV